MNRKVFLAGATGAIGRRLVPLLLDAGYEVFGTHVRREKPLSFRPPRSSQSLSMCSMHRRYLKR
jgi:nucleoside-diphosphate-sugar epimerase